MVKENKKIVLLEMHKIFLALQFLFNEEKDVFTEYGEGLVKGLLDPDTHKTMDVVHIDEYNKLKKENDKLLKLLNEKKSISKPKVPTKKKHWINKFLS